MTDGPRVRVAAEDDAARLLTLRLALDTETPLQ